LYSSDNVAAVCVYPNFTGIVQSHLEVENVKIAAVSANAIRYIYLMQNYKNISSL
jgi:hypothetical protein